MILISKCRKKKDDNLAKDDDQSNREKKKRKKACMKMFIKSSLSYVCLPLLEKSIFAFCIYAMLQMQSASTGGMFYVVTLAFTVVFGLVYVGFVVSLALVPCFLLNELNFKLLFSSKHQDIYRRDPSGYNTGRIADSFDDDTEKELEKLKQERLQRRKNLLLLFFRPLMTNLYIGNSFWFIFKDGHFLFL